MSSSASLVLSSNMSKREESQVVFIKNEYTMIASTAHVLSPGNRMLAAKKGLEQNNGALLELLP